jgi:hypothetical protein
LLEQGLVKMVRQHGGIARQGLTTLFNTKKEATTHVITNPDALKNLGDKFVKRVSRHNMKIVTEDWIVKSIEQEKLLDEKDYRVPGVDESIEALKKENDSENDDSNDSDYIETHVRKRKKQSPLDKRPRKKRNSERQSFDFEDGINLLIETQARES